MPKKNHKSYAYQINKKSEMWYFVKGRVPGKKLEAHGLFRRGCRPTSEKVSSFHLKLD
jgi:hypothetical protein